jgi:ubiquinone/menaquinone biosynthesis C-methylase UbiE
VVTEDEMIPPGGAGEEWSEAVEGWKRWEPYFQAGGWPVTQMLLNGLRAEEGMRVLDVGSGVGDPALMLALAVGKTGSVLATDPQAEMIQVCRERAEVLGLDNVSFRVADVDGLEEPQDSFDAISLRFSLMFMPEARASLASLRGMLRAGGRLAASVWTPPKVNPLFAIPSAELRKVSVGSPPPDPHEPGPLRYSSDGELRELLAEAGYREVRVTEVPLYHFARDAAEYWEFLTDCVPPFRRQYRMLDSARKEQVREGVIREVSKHVVGGVVRIPALARVGVGVK